jgi:hypothetical protein
LMGVRGKRRLVAFCYHSAVSILCAGGIYIGAIFDSPTMARTFAFLLLFHVLTFRIVPVSRWLQETLIREVECYACGSVIELEGTYKCGCGYISHRERHVFSPCPMCGKYYSWVVCPMCETSITI